MDILTNKSNTLSFKAKALGGNDV